LPSGLRKFADGLNAVRRDNLKQAVAQALSSLEPQERFVAVAEQLLAIAVAISAYPVLKVLAPKIGGGFFGQPDAEGRDSLFAMALYSAARLATPGREDAEHCLKELIESKNFKPAHASTALLALCQVDPEGLFKHLSVFGLREKLAEQFATYDPDGAVRSQVAQDILAVIGIGNLADALYELDALNSSVSGARYDDWLVEALLFTPNAPLRLVGENGKMKLCPRTTPTDCVVLDRRSPPIMTSRPVGINEPPTTYGDLAEISKDPSREITERMSRLFPANKTRFSGTWASP